ncbi:MAG: P1 family peptidase [Acidobacteria bacterium]|nr:P1 family peptidase [Acidobacteriota bacterium]
MWTVATGVLAMAMASSIPEPAPVRGLTAVDGIKVGHDTLTQRPTGCTVVLVERGAVAGVDVRGSAPGTRETDLLNPVNTVEQVHAVVLAGGSAFGLDAASGVMRYLEERGIGYDTGVARVPIVPAAVLFDLGVGDDPKVRPTADSGYRAATAASGGPVAEGNVGAGAGATVGKLAGRDRAMKGGIGTAAITLPDGLVVAALVAVNAAGDVIDPATGRVVAGVRTPDGRGLADVRLLLRSGLVTAGRPGDNTTIGVVATNARLTKAQANKVAQMAHDGLARAISPVHTPIDGDTVFALATGTRSEPADVLAIGALAADVMAEAIVRAVRAATSIPGFPAARDLGTK